MNKIVEAYRRDFPGDKRNDLELTVALGRERPDLLDASKNPDIPADVIEEFRADFLNSSNALRTDAGIVKGVTELGRAAVAGAAEVLPQTAAGAVRAVQIGVDQSDRPLGEIAGDLQDRTVKRLDDYEAERKQRSIEIARQVEAGLPENPTEWEKWKASGSAAFKSAVEAVPEAAGVLAKNAADVVGTALTMPGRAIGKVVAPDEGNTPAERTGRAIKKAFVTDVLGQTADEIGEVTEKVLPKALTTPLVEEPQTPWTSPWENRENFLNHVASLMTTKLGGGLGSTVGFGVGGTIARKATSSAIRSTIRKTVAAESGALRNELLTDLKSGLLSKVATEEEKAALKSSLTKGAADDVADTAATMRATLDSAAPRLVGAEAAQARTIAGKFGKLEAAEKKLAEVGWIEDAGQNLGIALTGGFQSGEQGYQEAKRNGASDEDAAWSYLYNFMAGTTEVVPIGNWLSRVRLSRPALGKQLVAIFEGAKREGWKRAGFEAFEESIQEAGQQLVGNATAREFYDKERGLWDNVVENAAVGGMSGFLFSGVATKLYERAKAEGAQFTPEEEKTLQAIGKNYNGTRASMVELQRDLSAGDQDAETKRQLAQKSTRLMANKILGPEIMASAQAVVEGDEAAAKWEESYLGALQLKTAKLATDMTESARAEAESAQRELDAYNNFKALYLVENPELRKRRAASESASPDLANIPSSATASASPTPAGARQDFFQLTADAGELDKSVAAEVNNVAKTKAEADAKFKELRTAMVAMLRTGQTSPLLVRAALGTMPQADQDAYVAMQKRTDKDAGTWIFSVARNDKPKQTEKDILGEYSPEEADLIRRVGAKVGQMMSEARQTAAPAPATQTGDFKRAEYSAEDLALYNELFAKATDKNLPIKEKFAVAPQLEALRNKYNGMGPLESQLSKKGGEKNGQEKVQGKEEGNDVGGGVGAGVKPVPAVPSDEQADQLVEAIMSDPKVGLAPSHRKPLQNIIRNLVNPDVAAQQFIQMRDTMTPEQEAAVYVFVRSSGASFLEAGYVPPSVSGFTVGEKEISYTSPAEYDFRAFTTLPQIKNATLNGGRQMPVVFAPEGLQNALAADLKAAGVRNASQLQMKFQTKKLVDASGTEVSNIRVSEVPVIGDFAYALTAGGPVMLGRVSEPKWRESQMTKQAMLRPFVEKRSTFAEGQTLFGFNANGENGEYKLPLTGGKVFLGNTTVIETGDGVSHVARWAAVPINMPVPFRTANGAMSAEWVDAGIDNTARRFDPAVVQAMARDFEPSRIVNTSNAPSEGTPVVSVVVRDKSAVVAVISGNTRTAAFELALKRKGMAEAYDAKVQSESAAVGIGNVPTGYMLVRVIPDAMADTAEQRESLNSTIRAFNKESIVPIPLVRMAASLSGGVAMLKESDFIDADITTDYGCRKVVESARSRAGNSVDFQNTFNNRSASETSQLVQYAAFGILSKRLNEIGSSLGATELAEMLSRADTKEYVREFVFAVSGPVVALRSTDPEFGASISDAVGMMVSEMLSLVRQKKKMNLVLQAHAQEVTYGQPAVNTAARQILWLYDVAIRSGLASSDAASDIAESLASAVKSRVRTAPEVGGFGFADVVRENKPLLAWLEEFISNKAQFYKNAEPLPYRQDPKLIPTPQPVPAAPAANPVAPQPAVVASKAEEKKVADAIKDDLFSQPAQPAAPEKMTPTATVTAEDIAKVDSAVAEFLKGNPLRLRNGKEGWTEVNGLATDEERMAFFYVTQGIIQAKVIKALALKNNSSIHIFEGKQLTKNELIARLTAIGKPLAALAKDAVKAAKATSKPFTSVSISADQAVAPESGAGLSLVNEPGAPGVASPSTPSASAPDQTKSIKQIMEERRASKTDKPVTTDEPQGKFSLSLGPLFDPAPTGTVPSLKNDKGEKPFTEDLIAARVKAEIRRINADIKKSGDKAKTLTEAGLRLNRIRTSTVYIPAGTAEKIGASTREGRFESTYATSIPLEDDGWKNWVREVVSDMVRSEQRKAIAVGMFDVSGLTESAKQANWEARAETQLGFDGGILAALKADDLTQLEKATDGTRYARAGRDVEAWVEILTNAFTKAEMDTIAWAESVLGRKLGDSTITEATVTTTPKGFSSTVAGQYSVEFTDPETDRFGTKWPERFLTAQTTTPVIVALNKQDRATLGKVEKWLVRGATDDEKRIRAELKNLRQGQEQLAQRAILEARLGEVLYRTKRSTEGEETKSRVVGLTIVSAEVMAAMQDGVITKAEAKSLMSKMGTLTYNYAGKVAFVAEALKRDESNRKKKNIEDGAAGYLRERFEKLGGETGEQLGLGGIIDNDGSAMTREARMRSSFIEDMVYALRMSPRGAETAYNDLRDVFMREIGQASAARYHQNESFIHEEAPLTAELAQSIHDNLVTGIAEERVTEVADLFKVSDEVVRRIRNIILTKGGLPEVQAYAASTGGFFLLSNRVPVLRAGKIAFSKTGKTRHTDSLTPESLQRRVKGMVESGVLGEWRDNETVTFLFQHGEVEAKARFNSRAEADAFVAKTAGAEYIFDRMFQEALERFFLGVSSEIMDSMVRKDTLADRDTPSRLAKGARAKEKRRQAIGENLPAWDNYGQFRSKLLDLVGTKRGLLANMAGSQAVKPGESQQQELAESVIKRIYNRAILDKVMSLDAQKIFLLIDNYFTVTKQWKSVRGFKKSGVKEVARELKVKGALGKGGSQLSDADFSRLLQLFPRKASQEYRDMQEALATLQASYAKAEESERAGIQSNIDNMVALMDEYLHTTKTGPVQGLVRGRGKKTTRWEADFDYSVFDVNSLEQLPPEYHPRKEGAPLSEDEVEALKQAKTYINTRVKAATLLAAHIYATGTKEKQMMSRAPITAWDIEYNAAKISDKTQAALRLEMARGFQRAFNRGWGEGLLRLEGYKQSHGGIRITNVGSMRENPDGTVTIGGVTKPNDANMRLLRNSGGVTQIVTSAGETNYRFFVRQGEHVFLVSVDSSVDKVLPVWVPENENDVLEMPGNELSEILTSRQRRFDETFDDIDEAAENVQGEGSKTEEQLKSAKKQKVGIVHKAGRPTHRLTAIRDNDTGRVYLTTTWRYQGQAQISDPTSIFGKKLVTNADGTQSWVELKKPGTRTQYVTRNLLELLAEESSMKPGTVKFTVLASVLTKDARRAWAQSFNSESAFRKKFLEPAVQLQSMEAQMQMQSYEDLFDDATEVIGNAEEQASELAEAMGIGHIQQFITRDEHTVVQMGDAILNDRQQEIAGDLMTQAFSSQTDKPFDLADALALLRPVRSQREAKAMLGESLTKAQERRLLESLLPPSDQLRDGWEKLETPPAPDFNRKKVGWFGRKATSIAELQQRRNALLGQLGRTTNEEERASIQSQIDRVSRIIEDSDPTRKRDSSDFFGLRARYAAGRAVKELRHKKLTVVDRLMDGTLSKPHPRPLPKNIQALVDELAKNPNPTEKQRDATQYAVEKFHSPLPPPVFDRMWKAKGEAQKYAVLWDYVRNIIIDAALNPDTDQAVIAMLNKFNPDEAPSVAAMKVARFRTIEVMGVGSVVKGKADAFVLSVPLIPELSGGTLEQIRALEMMGAELVSYGIMSDMTQADRSLIESVGVRAMFPSESAAKKASDYLMSKGLMKREVPIYATVKQHWMGSKFSLSQGDLAMGSVKQSEAAKLAANAAETYGVNVMLVNSPKLVHGYTLTVLDVDNSSKDYLEDLTFNDVSAELVHMDGGTRYTYTFKTEAEMRAANKGLKTLGLAPTMSQRNVRGYRDGNNIVVNLAFMRNLNDVRQVIFEESVMHALNVSNKRLTEDLGVAELARKVIGLGKKIHTSGNATFVDVGNLYRLMDSNGKVANDMDYLALTLEYVTKILGTEEVKRTEEERTLVQAIFDWLSDLARKFFAKLGVKKPLNPDAFTLADMVNEISALAVRDAHGGGAVIHVQGDLTMDEVTRVLGTQPGQLFDWTAPANAERNQPSAQPTLPLGEQGGDRNVDIKTPQVALPLQQTTNPERTVEIKPPQQVLPFNPTGSPKVNREIPRRMLGTHPLARTTADLVTETEFELWKAGLKPAAPTSPLYQAPIQEVLRAHKNPAKQPITDRDRMLSPEMAALYDKWTLWAQKKGPALTPAESLKIFKETVFKETGKVFSLSGEVGDDKYAAWLADAGDEPTPDQKRGVFSLSLQSVPDYDDIRDSMDIRWKVEIAAKKQIAVANYMNDVIERVFGTEAATAVFTAEGIAPDRNFIRNIVGLPDYSKKLDRVSKWIDPNTQQPVNAPLDWRVEKFKAQPNRDDVMRDVFTKVQSALDTVNNNFNQALTQRARVAKELDELGDDLVRSRDGYLSMDFMETVVRKSAMRMIRNMRKANQRLSFKEGTITATLDAIAGEGWQGSLKSDLLTGSIAMSEFLATVEALARDQEVNFDLPAAQLAEMIRPKVPPSQRDDAWIALFVGFGKTNRNRLIELEIRRLTDASERSALEAERDKTLKDDENAFQMVAALSRNAKTLNRVKAAFAKSKRELKKKGEELKRLDRTITIGNAIMAELRNEENKLSREFAVRFDYLFRDGMEVIVPQPGDTVESLKANFESRIQKLSLNSQRNPTNPEQMEKWIEAQVVFLADNQDAADDIVHRNIKSQADLLAENRFFSIDSVQEDYTTNFLVTLQEGQRLIKAFGSGVAQIIGANHNKFADDKEGAKNKLTSLGLKTMELEDRLFKAMGNQSRKSRVAGMDKQFRAEMREKVIDGAQWVYMMDTSDIAEVQDKAEQSKLVRARLRKLIAGMVKTGDIEKSLDSLVELIRHKIEVAQFIWTLSPEAVSDERMTMVDPQTGERKTVTRRGIPVGIATFSAGLSDVFDSAATTLANTPSWDAAHDELSALGRDGKKKKTLNELEQELIVAVADGKMPQEQADEFRQRAAQDYLTKAQATFAGMFGADTAQAIRESVVEPLVEMQDGWFLNPSPDYDVQSFGAPPEIVRSVWEASGGDMFQFVTSLAKRLAIGIPGGATIQGQQENPMDTARYVEATLKKLMSLHRAVKNLSTATSGDTRLANGTPNPIAGTIKNMLTDARTLNGLPRRWYSFDAYDVPNLMGINERIAAQKNFGRNGDKQGELLSTLKVEIDKKVNELERIRKATSDLSLKRRHAMKAMLAGVSGTGESLVKAYKAMPSEKRAGLDAQLSELEQWVERAGLYEKYVAHFNEYFKSKTTMVPEYNTNTIARLTGMYSVLLLFNPVSALRQLGVIYDPLAHYKVSVTSLKSVASGIGNFTMEMMDSFAQSFTGKERVQPLLQTLGFELAKRSLNDETWMEVVGPDAAINKKWRSMFDRYTDETLRVFLPRLITEAAGNGVGFRREDAQRIMFRIHPFIWTTLLANKALAYSNWSMCREQVQTLADFYRRFPQFEDMTVKEILNDKDARRKMLGMPLLHLGDKTTMLAVAEDMAHHGMSMEHIARRQNSGQPYGDKVFSEEEHIRLLANFMARVSLEKSLGSHPMHWFNGNISKIASTLLGWSLLRTRQIADMLPVSTVARYIRTGGDTPLDRKQLRHFVTGTSALLAIASAGMLTLTPLVDDYYTQVLKRRRNLRKFSADEGVKENAMAALEQVNNYGTLGLFGAAANDLLNAVGTTGGDNRGLDINSRIVVFSALSSVVRNANDIINTSTTDREWTWAETRRAIMTAGGNGLIHGMDMMNAQLGENLTGLPQFRDEKAYTDRMSAINTLRSYGRSLSMSVRTGAGYSSSTPDVLSSHVFQMELAAYRNNPGEFQQAYQNAINTARVNFPGEDPTLKIARKFGARNPMAIAFSEKPSEAAYRRLLEAMEPEERSMILKNVAMYNTYASMIDASEWEPKGDERNRVAQSPFQSPYRRREKSLFSSPYKR